MQPNIHSLKKEVIETHTCADPSTGLCSPLPLPRQRQQWADGLCWKSVEMHFQMTGANSCLSILPSDVLMGRCEPGGRRGGRGEVGGNSRSGSVLGCSERFLGFTPLLQQETGHGRCQQSVLARSLASLTLFTQSPPQLSRAPSIVNPGYTAFKHSPCMVQF